MKNFFDKVLKPIPESQIVILLMNEETYGAKFDCLIHEGEICIPKEDLIGMMDYCAERNVIPVINPVFRIQDEYVITKYQLLLCD